MATRTVLGLGLALMCAVSSAEGELNAAALAEVLEPLRADWDMPGLRAAVRYPGGRIVRASVGLADVEKEVALDDTMPMPGGSTGKTFAAALAMLLIEDGVMALDDPVSNYVGDRDWFARIRNGESMQVRHLLSHTSGFADYPGSVRFLSRMVWRVIRKGSAYFPPEELIGIAARRKARFPPGEGYQYTDAGYLILGRVMEAASGRDYYELLTERILELQELKGVVPQDRLILPSVPPAYQGGVSTQREDGSSKVNWASEWTGGGLATTPTDLAKFYAALANGRVVKQATFDSMLAAGHRGPEADVWRYGFGVFVWDGGESFGHQGMWAGYRTIVVHYLEAGITVAAQTNRDGPIEMWTVVNKIKPLL